MLIVNALATDNSKVNPLSPDLALTRKSRVRTLHRLDSSDRVTRITKILTRSIPTRQAMPIAGKAFPSTHELGQCLHAWQCSPNLYLLHLL